MAKLVNPLRTSYGLTNVRCLKAITPYMLITSVVENLLTQALHWKENITEKFDNLSMTNPLNIKRMSWLPRLLTVNLKASK